MRAAALPLVLLLGCASAPPDREAAILDALHQGAPDRALEIARRDFAERPNDVEAVIKLARVYDKVGETQRAERYYERAHQMGAPQKTVGPPLVRLAAKNGRYQVAVDRARAFLHEYPQHYETRLLLAQLLWVVDEPVGAERELRILQSLEPKRPEAYFVLGQLYKDVGRPEPARLNLRRFIALAPRSPNAPLAERMLREIEHPLPNLPSQIGAPEPKPEAAPPAPPPPLPEPAPMGPPAPTKEPSDAGDIRWLQRPAKP